MVEEPVVVASGLSKSFSGTKGIIEVLKNLDLTVSQGEVVGIIGASGVGKSTLLHILGSLDAPDSGTVTIKGMDIFSLSGREINRLRNTVIGFVFQFHYLLPDFTALENVLMPSLIGGHPSTLAKERAKRLLSSVGLTERIFHKPSELSGGEQQRVAVARALASDPEVIFADEPTGNVDDRASTEIHELIRDLSREEGKTFVIVTHKKDFTRYADRVLLLEKGILRAFEEHNGDYV